MWTIERNDILELYRMESKFYDAMHGDRTEEVRFYSELARNYGKKILELGVGTGALAIPLALEGFTVTGIDNSPEMLEIAEGKLNDYGEEIKHRLRLVNADMRSFNLTDKDFDFAFIASNTFLHLLDHKEHLDFLNSVRNHLRTRGGLVIDIFQIDPKRPEGVLRLDAMIKIPQMETEFIKYCQQHMDYARQLMDIFNVYTISERGNSRTVIVKYQLRIILRGELELLLDTTGFEVINVFRSFTKTPHDTSSRKIIILAEKK